MQSLAIVIPAFNEQDRLGRTLGSIAEAWQRGQMHDLSLAQVIVADDGSSDATVSIAEQWKDKLPMQVVRLPRNKGKGAAVRAGMQQVSADLALLYDADGAAPILEVNKLHAAMREKSADIAIGSRVLEEGRSLVTMAWYRRVIGRVYHFLGSALVPGIHDTACGCKLFKAEVAKKLFSIQHIDRFAFDIEVLALALRLKYVIVEVPLAWTAVPESKVRIIRDGIEMFWCLVSLYLRSWGSTLRSFIYLPPVLMKSKQALIALLIVLLAGFAYVNYSKRVQLAKELQKLTVQLETGNNPESAAQAQAIIDKVKEHIVVPTDVQPTVATIVDIEALKARNEFYRPAKNGDHLIVTPNRAILYDPDKDIILDVVPVQLEGGAAATSAAPTAQ